MIPNPPRFFNSYTRAVEPFIPLDPGGEKVTMYTCGPTVYDHAHIGNFRAYLFEDLLQRHLQARGYRVVRVMNITDVDDKTIRGCRQAGLPLDQFTAPFKKAFFEDLRTLRIREADHFPNATEPQYLARMIGMITLLQEKQIAYQADDGSVYFRLSKFPDYGKLAHLKLDELRPSGRVRADEYEKENIGDFALWKAWSEADGDVGWDSPWGRGRPGWHIECSAMATALLGPELDIHCGGIDNLFPHHEAEIAQSECCTGRKFVRFWLHCAHLMVDGQKMSKSLGNFFTLRDLLAKGFAGREVRFALLRVNYRIPCNFTLAGLDAARTALARMDEWVRRITEQAAGNASTKTPLTKFIDDFFLALDDDLNISAALGKLFELVSESNRAMDDGTMSGGAAAALVTGWERVNAVLAIEETDAETPAAVRALITERARARAAREWSESDRLRDEIEALGWQIKDTREGQKVSRR
ncbi:MAG TPA: cysteine--tRNA ligase [Chthoniobacteraceae bacterium]|nr:cysteine--tRNA ligase [Chthoniobacteraceae bacterium]